MLYDLMKQIISRLDAIKKKVDVKLWRGLFEKLGNER